MVSKFEQYVNEEHHEKGIISFLLSMMGEEDDEAETDEVCSNNEE